MSLERWLLAYLLLPLLLFVAGMFKLPWALLGLSLLGFAAWRCRPALASPESAWPASTGLMVVALALIWTLLGGYWGGLPMSPDWGVRLAMLRDLSLSGWPLQYATANGEASLLRAPLGFYLPAAAGGLLGGPQLAANLLALWTLMGIVLMLGIALRVTGSAARLGQAFLVCLALLLSGGLDLVGWLINARPWPQFGEHMEWWSKYFQYSSTTTGLLWVPNHVLPAWLGIGWIWLRRDTGLTPAQGLGLLTLAMPWSPLAMLGLAPFVAWAIWRARPAWRDFASTPALAWGLLFALLWQFHTWDTAGVPPSWPAWEAWRAGDFSHWFSSWGLFSLLEWGWLVLLLWRLAPERAGLLLAAALLLTLPLMRLGPGNDWVMRVGQPALCWLWLMALQAWFQPARPALGRWLLLALGLLGSVSSVQELAGSRLDGQRGPAGGQQLHAASGGAPHYFARMPPPGSVLGSLLREPHRAPPPVDAATAQQEKMRVLRWPH